MYMLDLVLLACSLTEPSMCREHHLMFESAGSLHSCVMQAPPLVAQWAGAHPKLRVVRWHCDFPEREQQPI